MEFLVALGPFLDLGRDAVYAAFAVFCRVSGAVALMPGFGEVTLPPRIKLAAAVVFTMVVFPAVSPLVDLGDATPIAVGMAFLAETVAGLLIGISMRLMIFALQTAGTIAAQSVSVSQMFGSSITGDMAPPYGNALALAGVAMAFVLGLPQYAASSLIGSYQELPFAAFPVGAGLADWGVGRVAGAFATAAALAAPFIVGAFAYNLALGAINRAMPQLMVAFVGAPAITAGALAMMAIATPPMLRVWGEAMRAVMAQPFTAAP
jgi:flagellar biosynthetic protein FliR